MLTDEQTTDLQFAIDAGDLDEVRRLLDPHSAEDLTALQFYGNSTAFMYACERSTPEIVRAFLDKGVQPFELEWSDNNELKSAVRNSAHAAAIIPLVLGMLDKDLRFDMITDPWDPDDSPQGDVKSAFGIAERLKDPTAKNLLLEALDSLGRS